MKKILGIDIGSISLSVVVLDQNKNILDYEYVFHQGDVENILKDIIKKVVMRNKPDQIAITSSSQKLLKYGKIFDSRVAIIQSAHHFHGKVGSILTVGGENFGLITFDNDGNYLNYKTNTSCAAGTGSFLDQQSKRLQLKNSSELSELALQNSIEPPKIATRCAVFAKTDLIHAQQEGYNISQISDGLSKGLAKTIADTLFTDKLSDNPIIFVGGVSKNGAVVKHLESFIERGVHVDELGHIYGSIGVSLLFIDEINEYETLPENIDDWFKSSVKDRSYEYDELKLKLSTYPDFNSLERYLFEPKVISGAVDVEVDIYQNLSPKNSLYLGIDIGSTSTKAVLIKQDNSVVAGFYTRTSGQPLRAVQAIFETIDNIATNKNCEFIIKGVATTGSGRKFVGKIVGADSMLDEITAHARAAYDLDPEIDTIIEIGGQDAKFTTMKDGMVTLSIMNNVCAAGTGSFIEEQAQKLGCSLSDYSVRAESVKAPKASDRCTVFMERDINHYLTEGYSVDEVLASILHSVRENYLTKVAIPASIGDKIYFQGATAKNRALVAAFEQNLQKPIYVSPFCHLTGALGAAITLAESNFNKTTFKGISLYKDTIPIESEICTLCQNNCKIKKITVQGEVVAFGFLCGRDYNTKKFIQQRKDGYSLVKSFETSMSIPKLEKKSDVVIGLPSGLYMQEEQYLWIRFFQNLGVQTVTSNHIKEPVKDGKKLTGTEFCAPMTSYYGHVQHIASRADYVFLPIYLDSRDHKDKEIYRQYCYYTQYAPSLVSTVESLNLKDRAIMPTIDNRDFSTKMELYKSLKSILNLGYLGYWKIATAYDDALDSFNEAKEQFKKIYEREKESDKVNVLLLGRPYTILSKSMNKGIPEIFSSMGVKSFFQSMLTYSKEDVAGIEPLLKAFHWNYAAKIVESAYIAAKTDGLYPVLITSFKCGPDSFVIEYFKRIMEQLEKPYLILQLDEHDSSVGYETRVEAALRSFQNHFEKKDRKIKPKETFINPIITRKPVPNKTMLLPVWDDYSGKLLEAILIRQGYDVRLIPVTKHAIQHGLRLNTAQCLPVNIVYQGFVDYIEENNLDPEKTVVWILDSSISCNIRMYPFYFKTMFQTHKEGWDKIEVFSGEVTFSDISVEAALDVYFAYMFGGMLRKIGCKLRPYEINKGETNRAIGEALKIFYEAFLGNISRKDALEDAMELFKKIEIVPQNRPKVAIFGDIYVRDNDLMNQNLLDSIEEVGGEVITTPYNEYGRMIADPYVKKWLRQGFYGFAFVSKAILKVTSLLEKEYYDLFNQIIKEPQNKKQIEISEKLKLFNVTMYHSGESFDNIIKLFTLKEHYPDISLFILTAPAFCCAGLVTEGMIQQIEKHIGVPIVSVVYDGTEKQQNDKIIPYIKYPRKKMGDVWSEIGNQLPNEEISKFKNAKYRMTTIIPYQNQPAKKVRVVSQEELNRFFKTYNKEAEFIVEIKQIDD
ncbi:CoA activase [bacterium]|nr:CoA activase [bacterium]